MNYSQPIMITKLAPGTQADPSVFQGLASSWSQDRDGDQLARGAFAESIDALHSGKRVIPLLAMHDWNQQVGGITSATETDDGLLITGKIIRGSPAADRVFSLAQAGHQPLSIGFLPFADATEKLAGGRWLFKQVDLLEVSAVTAGSNRESRVLSIKSLLTSPDEFERAFRERELPTQSRRLEAKMAQACFDILNGIDPEEREREERAKAEFHRVASQFLNDLSQRK